jgi:hypothetical protein
MWRRNQNNSFWSINSDAARRRRARSRRAEEERTAAKRAEEERLAPRPIRWEYHAPNNYRDVVYPPETECGRYVLPCGRTYYFDTQTERDEFARQHIAKIRPIWEAEMAIWEAEEVQRKAEMKAEMIRQQRIHQEKLAQIQREEEAYDAETAQLNCLNRKLRNIQDWLAGTHTWRGVRL